ncbi:MAG: hypothetical protein ACYDHD_12275 [Vulcanimicrobiaceae bacterium]
MIARIERSLPAAMLGLLALLLPAAGSAGTTTTTHTYNTSFAPQSSLVYPVTGSLRLTLGANGTVNGYYSPGGVRSFIRVIGGRTGNNIWFNIATQKPIHVIAKLVGKSIIGQAFIGKARTPYAFDAKPTNG